MLGSRKEGKEAVQRKDKNNLGQSTYLRDPEKATVNNKGVEPWGRAKGTRLMSQQRGDVQGNNDKGTIRGGH